MNPDAPIVVPPKREKVRSAWISFAGRIAAQLIGAAATVGLGVVVFGDRQPAHAAATPTAVREANAPSVLIARPVRTKEGTVVVFVPLDRYQDVTDRMIEEASAAIFTNLPPTGRAAGSQADTPKWAAANAH